MTSLGIFKPSLLWPTRIVHETGITSRTIYSDNWSAILGTAGSVLPQLCQMPLSDGSSFDVLRIGVLAPAQDKRETLNLGLQLRGALTPNWNIDTTISHFDVLKDTRATAFFNKNDPGILGRPNPGLQKIQLAEC